MYSNHDFELFPVYGDRDQARTKSPAQREKQWVESHRTYIFTNWMPQTLQGRNRIEAKLLKSEI